MNRYVESERCETYENRLAVLKPTGVYELEPEKSCEKHDLEYLQEVTMEISRKQILKYLNLKERCGRKNRKVL